TSVSTMRKTHRVIPAPGRRRQLRGVRCFIHREERGGRGVEINDITHEIIGAAIQVHRRLGPGLLESAYESCLEHELLKAGFTVERQYAIPLVYEGVRMDCGFRIDLLVEHKVVVETKVVERLSDVHRAQVLTYLKLSGAEVGLLINFNVKLLMDGVDRLVEGYRGPPPRSPRSPR
ncbi:MAG TPA: GxxExxY protein, partial [Spirochaetia bacterium]|nr:GxxExxY protein [Spirochaetia bacterium]